MQAEIFPQYHSLEQAFNSLDANGDGVVSRDEFASALQTHAGGTLSDEDARLLASKCDLNGDGIIDYSEFVVAAMNERQLTTNDKLQAAFKMFDKDNSGIISADEIKEVLQFGNSNSLSTEAVDKIIKQVDENGDGEISFEEFVAMMKNLGE